MIAKRVMYGTGQLLKFLLMVAAVVALVGGAIWLVSGCGPRDCVPSSRAYTVPLRGEGTVTLYVVDEASDAERPYLANRVDPGEFE